MVRDDDGIARAFSNTCRHRGCVVARGEGHSRGFVCPYHAWSYGLSGELEHAPTEMDESLGFDGADYGLIPIRLDSWGGFMFVNFDPAALLGQIHAIVTAQQETFGKIFREEIVPELARHGISAE